uniref:ATP synthase complex subunit 8 n=1 Tax=Cleptes metallicorpus TaxID=2491147 RepID=A0A3S8V0E4_9HYME|nr:ATP synthase F0 subunit 8 [Cleptes metallicorpus]
MPQMKPMMWLMIYIYSISTMFLLMALIHFMKFNLMKKNYKKIKKNSHNWKW